LLESLSENPPLFSHGYRRHRKNGDIVEVEVENQGSVKKIECDYLVAADGVKSQVRRDLDIQMIGDKSKNPYDHNIHLIHL
jgi:2-polyprenyl-6-methoxyphenol hydroxylase-like FAD-dependent oxidoreductase